MKRFFQPVEKDGSFKKPNISPSSFASPKNGEKSEETPPENVEENKENEPLKFLTWNANSFLLRIKNNWSEFTKFVENLDPDVIAIQVITMLFFSPLIFPSQFYVKILKFLLFLLLVPCSCCCFLKMRVLVLSSYTFDPLIE